MYCVFTSEDIVNFLHSENIEFEENNLFEFSPSDKGDKCHVDIKGFNNNLSKKLSKILVIKNKMRLCDNQFDLQNSDDDAIIEFLINAKNELSS